METLSTDILIIGSGAAGLALSLKMADQFNVTLLSKDEATLSSSALAQGGIAAVITETDSFEKHVQDTLTAGAGLCRRETVENIVRQAPARVRDLVDWGVVFDKSSAESFDLGREGGHQENRILHIKDQTGSAIHAALLKKAQENPRIQILQNHMAIDLLTSRKLNPSSVSANECIGCYVYDMENQRVVAIKAKCTVLATGGAGKVYLYTSNWSGATGDGIAMAYRAGARVTSLEFMQFHPTCLYHPDARNFLISETLRGEGAKLVNFSREEFMPDYHPLGNLAPRDIVARSMDAEIKKSGHPSVYLDISHKDPEFVKSRFPFIYKQCLKYGIDITKQPIPVVPAAHYLCGGVVTDINGATEIKSLFAIGETGCNGLHGANRLASNSLLECLATAHNTSEYLKSHQKDFHISPLPFKDWEIPPSPDRTEMIVIRHLWQEIRTLMWNYMGIVRTTQRLIRAEKRLEDISQEVNDYYWNYPLHKDILELRNLALVAVLMVRAALARKESVGIHYIL